MNARVDNSEGVGKFWVSWADENGRKLSCVQKRGRVWEICSLGKKDIHKFTWASGVDDRKSLLDLIVVQEKERNKLWT